MRLAFIGLCAALCLLVRATPAQAHLMVAQRGTLNIVDTGAFMVLSLPVSAFAGIDDDRDGRVSDAELNRHRPQILRAVALGLRLQDDRGPRPLEGVMLGLSPSHDSPSAPAAQIVVLGRYALTDPMRPLRWHIGLFGTLASEKQLTVTISRATQYRELVFTPQAPSQRLVFAQARDSASRAPATSARSLAAAMSRSIGAMPQLVQGKSRSAGT
jgi:hypothetical protein